MSAEEDFRGFIAGIGGVGNLGHADKIRLFAWLQHSLLKKQRFGTGNINWCYSELSYKPSNTAQLLKNMEGKELIKDGGGYYCEGSFREKYEKLYGEHEITLNIRQMVKNLASQIPDLGEKDIYNEAMICLRHNAGRATIIMVWNIAYAHLCEYVLRHKLTEFNVRIPVKYPKKWKVTDLPVISKYDDFGDNMSEREVIEVANSAGIITGDMYKVYLEKLGKRNSAAHPSSGKITQLQAEGFIDELVNHTVLLLKI